MLQVPLNKTSRKSLCHDCEMLHFTCNRITKTFELSLTQEYSRYTVHATCVLFVFHCYVSFFLCVSLSVLLLLSLNEMWSRHELTLRPETVSLIDFLKNTFLVTRTYVLYDLRMF